MEMSNSHEQQHCMGKFGKEQVIQQRHAHDMKR